CPCFFASLAGVTVRVEGAVMRIIVVAAGLAATCLLGGCFHFHTSQVYSAPSSACGHMEGVIAVGDLHKRCALAELSHELAHKRNVGERVARSLQEQHRDLHLEEMGRA